METKPSCMQVYSEQMSDSVCVPRIPPDGQESAALLRNAEINGFSNVNGGGSVLMVGTIDRNNLMLHRSRAAGEHTLPRPAANANQFSTMPRNNHTTTFQVCNGRMAQWGGGILDSCTANLTAFHR